jgi:hypothetical protein
MARFGHQVARRPAPLIVMSYDGWDSIQLCPLTRDYVFMNNARECENCHAPAGTVCSDMDCPGKKAEPAFPRDHQHDGHNGMSLRDYFAAAALQGMLACPVQPQSGPDMYARDAYTLADAMMQARGQ